MKIFMFIIMFLLIGAFFIISNENIKLNNKENITGFFSLYMGWVDSLLSNGKNVFGYVIKMEWLPDS